jgi:hypothetical protein
LQKPGYEVQGNGKRGNMKKIFFGLIVLYACIVGGLFGCSYFFDMSGWYLLLEPLRGKLVWTIVILAATFVSQALFVMSFGRIEVCRPVRKSRMIIPVALASMLMAFILYGLILSLIEFFEWHTGWAEGNTGFLIIMSIAWILWGIVFFLLFSKSTNYKAQRGIISLLLTGSLAELLASVTMHVFVEKRGTCLAGMYTSFGIACGIAVMIWSFGPGIVFLFLREKHRSEMQKKKSDSKS